MANKSNRNNEKAARVERTAAITGVKKDMVYKVIRGDRENEEVMLVYMELKEGENKLIEAVRKLVPFDFKNTKTPKLETA